MLSVSPVRIDLTDVIVFIILTISKNVYIMFVFYRLSITLWLYVSSTIHFQISIFFYGSITFYWFGNELYLSMSYNY